MRAHNLTGAYNKARFDWKKQVNASEKLSRGARLLATFLCDTYVNKNTGQCFPKNTTLANALRVTERTVQRWLGELEAEGWLCRVKLKGIRRAYQIAFSAAHEVDTKGDSKHVNLSPSGVTEQSYEHDTGVAPYKNQVDNQVKRHRGHAALPLILLTEADEASLSAWQNWFDEVPDLAFSDVLPLLRSGNGYQFPGRYPVEEKRSAYLNFFTTTVASKGANVPRRAPQSRFRES